MVLIQNIFLTLYFLVALFIFIENVKHFNKDIKNENGVIIPSLQMLELKVSPLTARIIIGTLLSTVIILASTFWVITIIYNYIRTDEDMQ